ncbi:hypothetical protein [Dyadobacter alkalitolerans]|uniref:hypothetical protein n=1 Tax=Dyadobacter alkalitolerans TaxID=492736 RepID=UPI00047C5D22|nr:hypothetical protein [Dyadobacter alkalitolerans]
MQRLILIFLFLGFLCFTGNHSSYAQTTPKFEIQVGYGPFAREQVLDDFVERSLRSSFNQIPKWDFSNSYAITYRYQGRRRIAIGLTSGFSTHTTYRTYYSDSKSFYRHSSFITAFETKFTYVDQPLVQLYAITGMGILIVKTKDQRIPNASKTYGWPTCQLTPIGVRIGKKFAGFAEIGYGYKGIVNFGVSARF